MIKEPEDEAFDELEKAQQRRELLVDKGCAERGCMGYDDRDGDTPVKMSIHRPWVGLTPEQKNEITWGKTVYEILELAEAKLKELNT